MTEDNVNTAGGIFDVAQNIASTVISNNRGRGMLVGGREDMVHELDEIASLLERRAHILRIISGNLPTVMEAESANTLYSMIRNDLIKDREYLSSLPIFPVSIEGPF